MGILHVFGYRVWNHDKYQWGKTQQMPLIQWHITLFTVWYKRFKCHFTYSPKTQQEENFTKSLITSYRVNARQLNFLEILCFHILSSQKFKLKLISAIFLLPMISRNELSITLSTLYQPPLNFNSILRNTNYLSFDNFLSLYKCGNILETKYLLYKLFCAPERK